MLLSKKNFFIMVQFFRRDCYVYSKKTTQQLINFLIIFPFLLSFVFAYLLPGMDIYPSSMSTTVIIGSILWSFIPLGLRVGIDILVDPEQNNHTSYQTVILHPRLFILVRILFAMVYMFSILIFFFPIIKIILGSNFDISNISWVATFLMLFLASLYFASFNIFFACLVPRLERIKSFFIRINYPMTALGGVFIPWSGVFKCSKVLGYLVLLNPLIYITEGLRRAIIGGEQFFPLKICIIAILISSLIFTLLAMLFFKRKIDHV